MTTALANRKMKIRLRQLCLRHTCLSHPGLQMFLVTAWRPISTAGNAELRCSREQITTCTSRVAPTGTLFSLCDETGLCFSPPPVAQVPKLLNFNHAVCVTGSSLNLKSVTYSSLEKPLCRMSLQSDRLSKFSIST